MVLMPPVDPTAKQTSAQRAARAFGRTRFGTWLGRALLAPLEPRLIEATRGRVGLALSLPTLNLTTRGRKSGQPRTATLVYFTRGDDVVLIASSFGRDKHPAWYLNLKADPHAELFSRGRRGFYVAREAEQVERDEMFALATILYAGYSQYQAGTERRIPVMILSPAPTGVTVA
ncbi:MAG: nitroreductase family deazaflavin-dependent oxidoreductase [Thermoleophilia bacterium]|nr:nitroreductase family deazaflavin-dependent oxidoreductase [Thermoleophilia bacterium]